MRVSQVRYAVPEAEESLLTLTSSQVGLHWGDRGDLWIHMRWGGERNYSRHTRDIVGIHRNLRRWSALCHLSCLIHWVKGKTVNLACNVTAEGLRWGMHVEQKELITDGVVDSSRCRDSSSSGRSSSRSEGNTDTSRSPATTGTRCCPGLQIPQTPTLEFRHTSTQAGYDIFTTTTTLLQQLLQHIIYCSCRVIQVHHRLKFMVWLILFLWIIWLCWTCSCPMLPELSTQIRDPTALNRKLQASSWEQILSAMSSLKHPDPNNTLPLGVPRTKIHSKPLVEAAHILCGIQIMSRGEGFMQLQ